MASSVNLLRNVLQLSKHIRRMQSSLSYRCRSLCTDASEEPAAVCNHEELFLRPDVQEILYKVTGFNLDKIFQQHYTEKAHLPDYKLLTDEQLKEQKEQAMQEGMERLQMPPYMNVRKEELVILSEDPEIEGHDESNYVFTDISYDISDKDRLMAVREPSGRLRLASLEERQRLLQVYFPREGRNYHMPHMFKEENLEEVLHRENYRYVLDRACLQFEPNEHDYLRVVHRTYEHVASRGKYDVLRSSRHFGPLTFYLTLHDKNEGLVADMVRRDLVADAAATVSLHHIIHPKNKSALVAKKENITDHFQLVMNYAKHGTSKGEEIELALQTYDENFQSEAYQ